jgi:hypothetical protein
MMNQYAIRRLHSLVHYDPRCQPVELTDAQIDHLCIDELFDDMMRTVVTLEGYIYEMRQLRSQISKKNVQCALEKWS